MRKVAHGEEVLDSDRDWLENIDYKVAHDVLEPGDLITWGTCNKYYFLNPNARGGTRTGYTKEQVIAESFGSIYRVPLEYQVGDWAPMGSVQRHLQDKK